MNKQEAIKQLVVLKGKLVAYRDIMEFINKEHQSILDEFTELKAKVEVESSED